MITWTQINNDGNGNPRYVCHYLNIHKTYEGALAIARKLGGRKFHNKQYGGGIVFSTYKPNDLDERIKKVSPEYIQQKENQTIEAINAMDYGWSMFRVPGDGVKVGVMFFHQIIDHLFDLAINTDEGLYHDAIKLLCKNKADAKSIKLSVGSYRYNKIMTSND